ASGSLSVRQTFGLSGSIPPPYGSSSMNAARPFPCGDVTTRKKLTSVTNGPSALSFRYMPGFSPDQSTLLRLNGGRSMFFSSIATFSRQGFTTNVRSPPTPDIELVEASDCIRQAQETHAR